ncbi:MAG: phosphoribosylformylglycinamidine synthase subunit PurQ, partial [Spirochaetaceae bacterium]|nr:phosphoribosylformylglycinamidine synthase subunit PurQ [Spirochaetaceae bacterium]
TDAAVDVVIALFGERTGTFIATCSPEHLPAVKAAVGRTGAGDENTPERGRIADIGEVAGDTLLHVTAGETAVSWSLDELVGAWEGLREMLGAARPQPAAGAAEVRAEVGRSEATEPVERGRTDRPTALLLTGYGINANLELAEAFRAAGADVREIHLDDLLAEPSRLEWAQIFALPGGFSYGDHVGSGLMLAHRLRDLRASLDAFRDSGRLILGICNGFQVLTKLGILPDLGGDWEQEVSLVHNDTGKFEDSWVTLDVDDSGGSPWLRGISRIEAPIRHGEGRFVVGSDSVLDQLKTDRRIAARYVGRNPNGSVDGIAGIVDRTGLVLGIMPHPEAFLVPQNHPLWTHRQAAGGSWEAANQAAQLFRNGVDHA